MTRGMQTNDSCVFGACSIGAEEATCRFVLSWASVLARFSFHVLEYCIICIFGCDNPLDTSVSSATQTAQFSPPHCTLFLEAPGEKVYNDVCDLSYRIAMH